MLRKIVKPRPVLRAVGELANAANGVQPLARKGYVTIPVFFLGWPTSELAPLFLTASVLDTARRYWRGHFTGKRGAVALALNAVTWAVLVFLQRRNVRCEPVFEAGLRETLGADYESVTAKSPTPRRRSGAFRTGWSRRRYTEKAVRYGPHRSNIADIWRRADLPRDGKAPVVLQVPGGAWAIGMRRPQAYPLLSHLAERGWVCVSIGYRVSPRHSWPAHIVDVKRALAWIQEHIAEYGGDPDFVTITGGSAGGHLTALAALTSERSAVPAGFRGRGHLGGGGGAGVRPLRLGRQGGHGPPGVHRVPAAVRRQEELRPSNRQAVRRRVAHRTVTRRRPTVLHPARPGRFDHPGAGGPRVRRRAAQRVHVAGGLRRGAARPARVRLLRLTARALHRDRRSSGSCPGCTPPARPRRRPPTRRLSTRHRPISRNNRSLGAQPSGCHGGLDDRQLLGKPCGARGSR